MVSTVIPVDPFDLVIFGATGDLAHRKILPSLFRRMAAHQMPPGSRVIGAARSKMNKAEFRKATREALTEFVEPKLLKPDLVEEFLASAADRRPAPGGRPGGRAGRSSTVGPAKCR
jgi:glucose-6-phosphate 1-dehydrogenase